MNAFNELTGNSGRNAWQIGRAPFLLSDLQLDAEQTTPLITAEDLPGSNFSFVADPFRFADGTSVHVFAEAWNASAQRGEIAAFRLDRNGEVEESAIVLAEPFHLSYPCIFRHGGETWMLPEAWESGRLALYRAEAFPWRWRRAEVLLELDYADPQIFFHEQTWYLFLTTDPLTSSNAALFWAESPLGPWHSHPSNAIVPHDALLARSAGPLVRARGHILRFSQDCRDAYGSGLFASEIVALSRSTFEARPLKHVDLRRPPWARTALHHLDVYCENGSWYALFDGFTRV